MSQEQENTEEKDLIVPEKRKMGTHQREIQRRVHLIVRLLNQGMTPYEIVHFILSVDCSTDEAHAEFQWGGLSERQLYNYVNKAYDVIEAELMPKTKAHYNQSLQRLNTIYRKAMEEGDKEIALKAVKEINRLTRAENFNDNKAEDGSGSIVILPDGSKIEI